MTTDCVLFGAINLKKEEIEDKRVIEAGSADINGSLRPLIESYGPKEYIGTDIVKGRGVDVICDIQDLVQKFGSQSFDAVICTEVIEHIRDWKMAIHNIKSICKTGGVILITTCSRGFPYHGYPHDFWRYEVEDMKHIFQDCVIKKIEKSPGRGVFVKAVKPDNFKEKNLSDFAIYSIVLNKRATDILETDLHSLYIKFLAAQRILRDNLHALVDIIFLGRNASGDR